MLGLTKNNGHLLVEGNAVAQVGPTFLIGFNRLLHQGIERGRALLWSFVKADNVLLECLQGLSHFRFESLCSHDVNLGAKAARESRKWAGPGLQFHSAASRQKTNMVINCRQNHADKMILRRTVY